MLYEARIERIASEYRRAAALSGVGDGAAAYRRMRAAFWELAELNAERRVDLMDKILRRSKKSEETVEKSFQ